MYGMDGVTQVQPTVNELLGGEMSYLYGRDPSILAYGQRPIPSHESRKNLMSMLDGEKEDNVTNSGTAKISGTGLESRPVQTIKVFLRVKPLPPEVSITPQQAEAYTILNSTTLLTKVPSLDQNSSCLKKSKCTDVVCKKFLFTQTFGPNTTQLQLFEQAVKPQMMDFLNGRNSIIMSYGTTNSGKTFTLQGTAESPGIIPRGIDFVFSNINPRMVPSFKPHNQCDIIHLNHHDRVREMNLKMKILAYNSTEKNVHASTYKQMQELLKEESQLESDHSNDSHFSVWVSFAEIYNEAIYDLLWNDGKQKRPVLKLANDSHGGTFIKGLKSICVSSGAEAYQVFMSGQENLKVAATALNSRSSRSHCIFTIKLLECKTKHNPFSVRMSTFTFCDLAGSERLKKTLNVGDRLKEAQNINTSLLVLGRCLKTIHETQSAARSRLESIGPFRESKLTRLFQKALSGGEQIALIVNINPVPDLYIETQNVLNFSAIAKKIVIEHRSIVGRRHSHSRFSRLVTQSMRTEMDWENTDLEDASRMTEEDIEHESHELEDANEEHQELLVENESLRKEIEELRASALVRDLETRREMTNMYSEIMEKLESEWKNRMIDMEEQQEDLRELTVRQMESFYRKKITELNTQRQSHTSLEVEIGGGVNGISARELEIENAYLRSKINRLEASITDLRRTKELREMEASRATSELITAKEEKRRVEEILSVAQKSLLSGDAAMAVFIEELNATIQKKNERIKMMKTFLDEAKGEYIFITSEAQKMEQQIQEKDEVLLENAELIRNLEAQLGQMSMHSEEQSKMIENLEEKLEHQSALLSSAEIAVRDPPTKEINSKHITRDIIERETHGMGLVDSHSQLEGMMLGSLRRNGPVLHGGVSSIGFNPPSDQLNGFGETRSSPATDDSRRDRMGLGIPCSLWTESTTLAKGAMLTAELCDESTIMGDWENQSLKETGDRTKRDIPKKDIIRTVLLRLNEYFGGQENSLDLCITETKEVEQQLIDVLTILHDRKTAMVILEQRKNEDISSLRYDLNKVVKHFLKANEDLGMLVEARMIKESELRDQVAVVVSHEQDREKEITSLQKEMKILIQCNETTVKSMEVEMKAILKELTYVKDQLLLTEDKNRKMDKDYKKVVHILQSQVTNVEKKMKEKQDECVELTLKMEEIKKSLNDAEHELEVFIRNRDETVRKYEELVKSKEEKLDSKNKEVIELMNELTNAKENTDDRALTRENVKKLRCCAKEERKKITTRILRADTTEDVSDTYSDDSDGKKSDKLSLHLSKNSESIKEAASESRGSSRIGVKEVPVPLKKTKRKKLFTVLDESFLDIDQTEPSPSPCSSTRNLRNRRK